MMDYPWAVVGAKVVCIKSWINPYPNDQYSDIRGPQEGEVVTIREILPSHCGTTISIRLVEYINRQNTWSNRKGLHEQAFTISRFRPLEKKKLPDVLTSILINPKKKIEKDQFDLLRV